jgi:hypothetical protein
MKIKLQFEDAREKLKHYQEENIKIMEQKKYLEEKQTTTKLTSHSIKSAIKDKDNEINKLREDYKILEEFRVEKPKLEKKISDQHKQIVMLKEDQE